MIYLFCRYRNLGLFLTLAIFKIYQFLVFDSSLEYRLEERTKPIFSVVFRPNKLLESCSEARHRFLQTLYQI